MSIFFFSSKMGATHNWKMNNVFEFTRNQFRSLLKNVMWRVLNVKEENRIGKKRSMELFAKCVGTCAGSDAKECSLFKTNEMGTKYDSYYVLFFFLFWLERTFHPHSIAACLSFQPVDCKCFRHFVSKITFMRPHLNYQT